MFVFSMCDTASGIIPIVVLLTFLKKKKLYKSYIKRPPSDRGQDLNLFIL